MKRSLMASLFLVAMCAIASGSRATPPATSSATPASATAPQFGACRWYCGSKSFTTLGACQAACSNDVCEEIC